MSNPAFNSSAEDKSRLLSKCDPSRDESNDFSDSDANGTVFLDVLLRYLRR